MIIKRVRRLCIATILVLSCRVGSTYYCDSDPQCLLGDARGRCESTGYCSFADSDCSSGRRYGRWAPSSLASACVSQLEMPSDMAGSDASDASACGGDLQPCCA